MLILFYLFYFNKEIFQTLYLVKDSYFNKYLISLFPFILFTNILLSSNCLIDVHSFLSKRNLNFLFEYIIILLTILIGIPGNISFLNYLSDSKIISKSEKRNLINCFGGISFPFIYLVILQENTKKFLLISLLIVIELIIYFLNKEKSKKESIDYKIIQISPINKTGYSLFLILFSLLFFSLFTIPLNYVPSPFNFFFKSLIEFSYNMTFLSKINTHLSNFLLSITLSFSSLSLIFQVKLIDINFKIIDYLKKRAIITLFYISILFILI